MDLAALRRDREGRLAKGIECSVRVDAYDRAGVAFVFERQQRQFNDFICVGIESRGLGVDEDTLSGFTACDFERPVARGRNPPQQSEVWAGLNEASGLEKIHLQSQAHAWISRNACF